MLFVVLGTSAGKTRDEIMAIYPRHKAFVEKFMERSDMVGIGPFTDRGGGIWVTSAAGPPPGPLLKQIRSFWKAP